MRLCGSLLAVPLLFAAAAPAAAQSTDGDVRCFMASSIFSQMDKDPKRKQLAAYARFYFLGRIDGRVATPVLKAKMVELGKTIPPNTLGSVMDGCVKQLQAREQSIVAIGREISATQKGAAPAPKK